MPDIRQRVEEEQGILKKIQMFVPGFRGYRRRDDLRDADRMLRDQLAVKLGDLRRQVEDSRALVVNTYRSKELELMGGLINEYKKLEGLVKHSTPGWSGISADIQFKEDKIFNLYDYDASMIEALGGMQKGIDQLRCDLTAQDSAAAQRTTLQLKSQLTGFEQQFKRRIDVIQGTEA
ncbi:hypothetical protein [Methanomassiliicoccus luminyensis]|jgi:hypothetical protein|uniref:hypothetical protein n=1 Tax=Methanomassiliicoccus luminyensis TaxID=1080712 RepID=UPI0003622CD9|nr:hypothetical protein [Methanomassiliicoccus luminyensis]